MRGEDRTPSERFPPEGTMQEALASMKRFRPKPAPTVMKTQRVGTPHDERRL
jgi:hypothetical protein